MTGAGQNETKNQQLGTKEITPKDKEIPNYSIRFKMQTKDSTMKKQQSAKKK